MPSMLISWSKGIECVSASCSQALCALLVLFDNQGRPKRCCLQPLAPSAFTCLLHSLRTPFFLSLLQHSIERLGVYLNFALSITKHSLDEALHLAGVSRFLQWEDALASVEEYMGFLQGFDTSSIAWGLHNDLVLNVDQVGILKAGEGGGWKEGNVLNVKATVMSSALHFMAWAWLTFQVGCYHFFFIYFLHQIAKTSRLPQKLRRSAVVAQYLTDMRMDETLRQVLLEVNAKGSIHKLNTESFMLYWFWTGVSSPPSYCHACTHNSPASHTSTPIYR